MKESITKFDIEAAFKALDEIATPIAEKGIKANKPALTEIFSRKSKFDSLFEEYYDIGNTEELSDAKEMREAEVAKAKLARIEKIVDLDAESPEDLLTSYVGKFIIQCPQCMTLFYKNPEDIEESEDDTETVNVNEVCQHCGNESGYTLIGKVGEATAEEEMPEEASETEVSEEELPAEGTTEDEPSEASEASEAEDSEEDFDLGGELDALDLDLEEEEETETNEAFQNEHTNSTSLTEDLTEETELETSAEDFEKLIKSAEFKKPISDNEVRAMMQELDDTESDKEVAESLQEGIFDKLINKLTGKLKSREDKANWILKNALENYNDISMTDSGEVSAEKNNRKFGTFVVIGYKNKYKTGKAVVSAPSYDNRNLVPGMKYPEARDTYSEAEKLAKGWSMQQDNGPAFIFLAKNKNDTKLTFLCEYFKGELAQDFLEKYFNKVKQDLAGADLIKKSGGLRNQSDTENVQAINAKPGMVIKLKGDKAGEILEIGESILDDKGLNIKIKTNDGATTTCNVSPEFKLKIFKSSIKTESFEKDFAFMSDIEELQESALETLISTSLTEAYENVAGFRLTECTYLNETLNIDGTIYFTSGNTRKTTYKFTEAYTDKNAKVKLRGLNEKLGIDKQFILLGSIDKTNKSFIAESFSRVK